MCRVYKMAAFLRVTFVVLICWMQRCNGLDARLTIVPNPLPLATNMLNIGGKITIRCEPPQSSVVKTLLAMTISKKPTGNPDGTSTVLAIVEPANDGKAQLKASLQGATVDGSLINKFIQLSLNQTKCADQNMYHCKATYLNTQNEIKSSESNEDFFLDVTPGQLSVKAQQRFESGAVFDTTKTEWIVNETLVLTCTGSVGSVRTEDPKTPQLRWMWEYRYSDKIPLDWTLYDGVQTDITFGQQTTTPCNVDQTNILTRQLTIADSGRDYRCVVQRGPIKYDQFNANYSVVTVKEKDSGTGDDEPGKPDTASVGGIVGGVLGGLLVVAIILIVIYFLVIRPRRQKQAETYAEDPAKGDGPDPSPAVTADPTVIYTQPNNRRKDKKSEGVTNKALDESDEGKVPHDNDDKRHGRRHKDKKQPPEENPATDEPTAPYNGDLHYAKLDHEQRHGRRNKDAAEDKPRSRRGYDGRRGYDDDDRHDYDRRDHDDDRRGRRRRDVDDHDEYGQGRQNRGYEYDNRRRGRHDSSDDGGTDTYINTSMGHGDPTMGTAI